MEADLRIVVGNLEPHHFMGFSGGAKSAAIGLAGRSTINSNHAMLPHPNAKTGHYEDNPMRQDVEAIGRMIGIHFAINAILNLEKEIVQVVAGDPTAVMLAGIPLARQVCQVPVLGLYDLVIASAGGHPKDINFYQSQKALTHSALITRDQGKIILAAACPEGSGSLSYEHFMEGLDRWEAVVEQFQQQGFQVGPHKAFQVARIISRTQAILVSQLPPEQVKRLLLKPAPNLDSAIGFALADLGPDSRIAVMPYAVTTVPVLLDIEQ
jgi:nickel-dependent lactate racemase